MTLKRANIFMIQIILNVCIFCFTTHANQFTVANPVTLPDISVQPQSMSVTGKIGQIYTQQMMIANAAGSTGELNIGFITRETGRDTRDALSTSAEATSRQQLKRDFAVISGGSIYVTNRVIVRFNSIVSRKTAANIIATSGGRISQHFSILPDMCVVDLPPGQSVEEALKVYNGSSKILYAEPDYQWKASATIPDDTQFDELWGMYNTGQEGGTSGSDISAPDAWDIITGRSNIIVAVIDSGVDYTHEDLADNMWINPNEIPANGIDDDTNGYIDDIYGYDFVNDDADPIDDHDHGTHCAGILGAVGNNGVGVAGVCWDMQIIALKFLNPYGIGSTAGAIASIEYAVREGARVINGSWGGNTYSQALKDAIDATETYDIIYIAAAGNTDVDNDTEPHYPSSYDLENIIAVMSTDQNDERSTFSCWGSTTVDIAAPGTDILSCVRDGYEKHSGTSMATPHVSGACAQLLALNPMLTGADVKNILLSTVDVPATPLECVTGGRMNIASAIRQLRTSWLDVQPDIVMGIATGESAYVDVLFSATEGVTLHNYSDDTAFQAGTYSGEVVVTSNDPDETAITVPVLFTVLPDELAVTPTNVFHSSGLERGPFSPSLNVYVLENTGTGTVTWAAYTSLEWLAVSPTSNVLNAGATNTVTVELNAQTDMLPPGVYNDTVNFYNKESGVVTRRAIKLNVKAAPGEIDVTDSIPPIDDLSMDFGEVHIGAVRKEHITIHNIDPLDSLVVSNIYMNGSRYITANDYFTEYFGADNNDLNKVMLSFMPDNGRNFYRARCDAATAFPVDPTAATVITLSNDGYAQIILTNGAEVVLYGRHYSILYVGANGYITFVRGDTSSNATVYSHFKMPRVSALFDNLNPSAGGAVSWMQCDDKCVVTYLNVPQSNLSDTNSFQIEMFYNGMIRMTYLNIDATGGLAGLSEGKGVPNGFIDSDLNAYPGETGFYVSGIPDLPYTINPLESVLYDVTYTPRNTSVPTNTIVISCNDPDTPFVELELTGRGITDTLQVEPARLFYSHGMPGGPFSPDSNLYTLRNTGTNTLVWRAAVTNSWLHLHPTSGTLSAGDVTNVLVSLAPDVNMLPYGSSYAPIIFSNDTVHTEMIRDVHVKAEYTLAWALGQPDWTIKTGGKNTWQAQAGETHSGTAAAQSGVITYDQESWMETTLVGIGELSFWWNVSSQAIYDNLVFYINGISMQKISGAGNWQKRVYTFDSMTNTLRWTYMKNSAIDERDDCGWVDDVVWNRYNDILVDPEENVFFFGYEGGPFLPSYKEYTLWNVGSNSLHWTATNNKGLINVYPTNGVLNAGDKTLISISISTYTLSLLPSNYTDTVTIVNNDNGTFFTRSASILINTRAALPSAPYDPVPPNCTSNVLPDQIMSWSSSGGITRTKSLNTGDTVLYTGDSFTEFGTLNRTNGLFTLITHSALVSGLTYDPNKNILYATTTDNRFGIINPVNGAFTSVSITSVNLEGLAIDYNRGIIYAFDADAGQLYTLEAESGRATPVGVSNGSSSIGGLAYDPRSGTLYGVDDVTETILVALNTCTGTAIPIGNLGSNISDVDGITFCEEDSMLYGLNNGMFLAIDPITGKAREIGDTEKIWGGVFGIASAGFAPGTVRYDLYLDTESPPLKMIVTDYYSNNFYNGELSQDESYYWRVIAKNNFGSATGDVWCFSTVPEPVWLLPYICITCIVAHRKRTPHTPPDA